MRPVRTITAEEENFRTEPFFRDAQHGMQVIRRNPIEPEPVGTIILMAFRITGYCQDCDGSLLAELDHIDRNGEHTGWSPKQLGLYPDTDLVVEEDELSKLWEPDHA